MPIRLKKTTEVALKNFNVSKTASMITVTGEESIVHTPNVNKKNAEQVVPKKKRD